MTADLPKIYGPYKAIRLIGRGGMGCVYEAIHTQIQRRVALKVLSDNLAGDRKLATRFLNEARAVNIVSHPSLVIISDFGEQDGIPFIVMEYLEGQTLSERVKSLGGQTMPPGAALLIARQVASGLDAAHTKGIVHRDLKPSNIMLVPDPEMTDGERIKILDFGVAKFLEGQPGLGSDHSSLTNADSRLGTPLFMSPEQCRNSSEVTDRADIYSLGVLCYWLLSGVHPFRGATDMAIIMQHLTATARPLQELVPNTPQPVCELVEAMLAKAPNERPSARDVINVLAPLLRGPLSYNGLPTVGSTTPEAVERMPRLPAPFSGGYAVIPTAAAPTAATSGSFPAPSPAAVPTAATSGSFPAPSLATSAAAVAPGSPAGPPVAAPSPTTEPSTGQAADGEALRFPQLLPAAPPRTQRHARIDPDSTAKTESVIGALGRVAVLARESVSDGDKPAAPRHQVLTPIAPPPKRWARPVAIAAGVLAILGLVLWLLLGGQ